MYKYSFNNQRVHFPEYNMVCTKYSFFENCQIVSDLAFINFYKCCFVNCTFKVKSSKYDGSDRCLEFSECTVTNSLFQNLTVKDLKFRHTVVADCQFYNNVLDVITFRYSEIHDNLYSNNVFKVFYTEGSEFVGQNYLGGTNEIKNVHVTYIQSEHLVPPYLARVLEKNPKEGGFYAYKLLRVFSDDEDIRCVGKLWIPPHAARLNGCSNKCRASEALVIYIKDEDGKYLQEAYSLYDKNFEYVVGKIVRPRFGFYPDRWQECASGIHYFLTEKEAWEYDW